MEIFNDQAKEIGPEAPGPKPGLLKSTWARVLIAIPWLALTVVVVAFGGLAFAVTVGGFAVLALHELYLLLREYRPLVLAGIIATIALVASAALGGQYYIVLTLIASLALTFLLSTVRKQRQDISASMAVTVFGIVWIGLALAHAVLLRDLSHGGGLVVDVLAATFIADTAAYLAGRLYGRRPLAPRISPNKTVEGLVAGLVFGTLAFWVAGLWQDWISGYEALGIGLGVSIAAPLGDLFESYIKRDIAVKDSGSFFGVHGGVLDRLDALLFTVVAGYYLSRAILPF